MHIYSLKTTPQGFIGKPYMSSFYKIPFFNYMKSILQIPCSQKAVREFYCRSICWTSQPIPLSFSFLVINHSNLLCGNFSLITVFYMLKSCTHPEKWDPWLCYLHKRQMLDCDVFLSRYKPFNKTTSQKKKKIHIFNPANNFWVHQWSIRFLQA